MLQICRPPKTSAAIPDAEAVRAAGSISTDFLREVVKAVSIPRHYIAESVNNRAVARWIDKQFQAYGYKPFYQGKYANLVVLPYGKLGKPVIFIGAHYDSVPGTPGADDNGSAIAALLGCAKALAPYAGKIPIGFLAFNREEDGLLGSADFVTDFLPASGLAIRHVHVLEMVGYCKRGPKSQQIPPGLPVSLPDTGDFIGIIANKKSNKIVDGILEQASVYLPGLSVIGLKVFFGLERFSPHLGRSDHGPFWKAGLPALMWTDTAEFRNPNYHLLADMPDTLDYSFLRSVTQLLAVHSLLSG
ncbi:MAG: M28 family peptidase [Gammaproteobacteria bacterium]|nr:M28 family peptidase [Gammaproteobacteria bacterium]